MTDPFDRHADDDLVSRLRAEMGMDADLVARLSAQVGLAQHVTRLDLRVIELERFSVDTKTSMERIETSQKRSWAYLHGDPDIPGDTGEIQKLHSKVDDLVSALQVGLADIKASWSTRAANRRTWILGLSGAAGALLAVLLAAVLHLSGKV